MESDDSDSENNRPLGFVEDEEGDDEYWFGVNLEWMKQNDPDTTELSGDGSYAMIQNMINGGWEEIGRDISNNSYLKELNLKQGALNDNRMSFLFRGLTRSTSIEEMILYGNGLSISGVRSMVPFLQNANSLRKLDLDNNNIKSVGFNILFRALRDSPIEELSCNNCGIDSIEIDNDCFPRHFDTLCLNRNIIDASGCREVAKLLQGADSNLNSLWLCDNVIDDEGVAILVDALQNNISLETLGLEGNEDISKDGKIMLLKLVNDVASIKATLQSNHTLGYLKVEYFNEEIQTHINVATEINESYRSNPERVGREKVIQIQLTCVKREELADLQGVNRSLYSEINPLHLPEVLSLIGERHGQGELYAALSSSIMTLLSTVNRKKYVQQQRDYHEAIIAKHAAKIAELRAVVSEHAAIVAEMNAELAAMEEKPGEGNEEVHNVETQSRKRRRV